MLFARSARIAFRTLGSALLLGPGFALGADPVPVSPSVPVPASTPAVPSVPSTPAPAVSPSAAKPAPAVAPAAKPAPVVVRAENLLTQEEQSIVDLTNNERARYGLPAFTPTPALMRLAREQSQLMASARVMSHAVNGRHLTSRLQQAGYPTYTVAENCGMGVGSPQQAVQMWMNSAGHRTNLLNGGYREIGVAMAWGGDGRPYYTQVFSAPVGIPVETRVITSTPVVTKTVAPAPVAPAAPVIVPAGATSPGPAGSGVVPASGTSPAK